MRTGGMLDWIPIGCRVVSGSSHWLPSCSLFLSLSLPPGSATAPPSSSSGMQLSPAGDTTCSPSLTLRIEWDFLFFLLFQYWIIDWNYGFASQTLASFYPASILLLGIVFMQLHWLMDWRFVYFYFFWTPDGKYAYLIWLLFPTVMQTPRIWTIKL